MDRWGLRVLNRPQKRAIWPELDFLQQQILWTQPLLFLIQQSSVRTNITLHRVAFCYHGDRKKDSNTVVPANLNLSLQLTPSNKCRFHAGSTVLLYIGVGVLFPRQLLPFSLSLGVQGHKNESFVPTRHAVINWDLYFSDTAITQWCGVPFMFMLDAFFWNKLARYHLHLNISEENFFLNFS